MLLDTCQIELFWCWRFISTQLRGITFSQSVLMRLGSTIAVNCVILIRDLFLVSDRFYYIILTTIVSIPWHGNKTIIFFGFLWYFRIAIVSFFSLFPYIWCIRITTERICLFLSHPIKIFFKLYKLSWRVKHKPQSWFHCWRTWQVLDKFNQKILWFVGDLLHHKTINNRNSQHSRRSFFVKVMITIHTDHFKG